MPGYYFISLSLFGAAVTFNNIMSTAAEEDDTIMMFCASCGIAGGDDINLKRCNGCYLVRYCGVKCQKDHWKQHKKGCKKRAAELKDEILFKQPESNHYGDCPICCLPLPIDAQKSTMYQCCSKYICLACSHANVKREIEGRLERKCPFCRTAAPKTDEESNERMMNRVEANDSVAMREIGLERYHKGDYMAALEYSAKAAALGDADAHFHLSTLYLFGLGVEKDKKKQRHHLEQAAIGGHPGARHNLALLEGRNGQHNRAAKHWIIAAKLGCDNSLKCVRDLCKDGHVSKEDYAAALRGHKAAIDATKNPQRERAYEFFKTYDILKRTIKV